jgi:hypothetical protein
MHLLHNLLHKQPCDALQLRVQQQQRYRSLFLVLLWLEESGTSAAAA